MTPAVEQYRRNMVVVTLATFCFLFTSPARAYSHVRVVHGGPHVFSKTTGFAPSRTMPLSCGKIVRTREIDPISRSITFNDGHVQSRTSKLFSSIPGDDDDHNKNNGRSVNDTIDDMFRSIYKKLPPFPENTLILGGDVGWLFFYSLLDHILHDIFVQSTASQEPNIVGIHAAWIDLMHKPAEFMAASSEYGMAAPYSPALASGGICAVLFATLWLVNGYFQQSFSFQNTVTCDSHTAVKVAGKLWLTTAIGMLALAYASDALQLAGLQHQVGGLTQTDLDFILDSLPVMVCWRWMIAWIFNGFK